MATIKSSDRCKDCKHCRVWTTNHRKANCTLYNEQGFHPGRGVPSKCVGKTTRKY